MAGLRTMAIPIREDAPARGQVRPAVDVTKIVIWVAGAILPWTAIAIAVKFALGGVP